jgi:hypothetical protein
MPLHVAVEALPFLEQCLLLIVGKECCSIILPLPSVGVYYIHIHGIVILPSTLAFSFQGLLLLIAHIGP